MLPASPKSSSRRILPKRAKPTLGSANGTPGGRCVSISIAFLAILPISIFSYGRADLVPSDLLILAAVPLVRFTQRRHMLLMLVIVFALYCGAIALYSTVAYGDAGRLGSAVKFLKPYFFIVVGLLTTSRFAPHDVLSAVTPAIAILTWCLMGSTVITPGFPSIRWGSNLFGVELYGFPNSSAVFLAAFAPLVLTKIISNSSPRSRLFYLVTYFFIAALAALSLSRSAIICLIIGTLCLFVWHWPNIRLSKRILTTSSISFTVLVAAWLVIPEAIWTTAEKAIDIRWQRTFERDDLSSGRFEIWAEALSMIADHPLIGYAFESYADAAQTGHGTVHNQYIEVLWKTGAIGLVLFGSIWLIILITAYNRSYHVQPGGLPNDLPIATFCILTAILASNLTQPNFTYSVTGNYLGFICGIICRPETPPLKTQLASIQQWA